YIGRLVWNRLRYAKDPATGRRVSRPNPPADWVVAEVPELRIVDDALWEAVKRRQDEIMATPAVAGIRASRFWERRRARHLLTGLVHCAACGSRYTAVGRDYLGCAGAHKLGTCAARRRIR
ncbi:recombinase family protein, partial [Paralimibaculum aggregatum]|uniref:recombinase family protein n=1 Tax=Paralimibaculum aggregatum TaxID=3036245 RepID=UPI002552AAC8